MCYMFKENGYNGYNVNAKKADSPTWQSYIIAEKVESQMEFSNTGINGVARGFEFDDDKKANLTICRQLCIRDAQCVAYSHCDCPDKEAQCTMYSKESISGLEHEDGTTTFFISSRREKPTTPPTPTTKSSGN
ncbi:hypothetical protein DPMN_093455 [Dreissena polymorpha]|uniref:Apple domain-containing protein n=1 Tax=Dreissena polymorpha TaxID=45954 RepID=A0A9D4R109_DREPO|nr:hypothetical protein DPMN_093455 [Dreissena polymorpha]